MEENNKIIKIGKGMIYLTTSKREILLLLKIILVAISMITLGPFVVGLIFFGLISTGISKHWVEGGLFLTPLLVICIMFIMACLRVLWSKSSNKLGKNELIIVFLLLGIAFSSLSFIVWYESRFGPTLWVWMGIFKLWLKVWIWMKKTGVLKWI